MTSGAPHQTPSRRTAAGFSLTELMIVVALLAVAAAFAIPVTRASITSASADSAVSAALNAIDLAHDRAVAERRNIILTFVDPNRIRLERQEVPGPGTTVIAEYTLENGQQFHRISTLPDTPDEFGGTGATAFTGTAPVMFTSDGSLVDSNGDVVNGTIFIARDAQAETARAVTVFGVTGLLHTWKWRGGRWME